MKTKQNKRKIPQNPGMLRRHQVAQRLGVGPRQLFAWRRDGTGPPVYKIGTQYKYDAQQLEAWIADRRVGQEAARARS